MHIANRLLFLFPFFLLLFFRHVFCLMGRFEDLDMEEQIGMLEVNCKALTWLTYECIPYMCKNGRIIQLASSAAFAPQKNFAVYAATKSYVLSFSRSLGRQPNIAITVTRLSFVPKTAIPIPNMERDKANRKMVRILLHIFCLFIYP